MKISYQWLLDYIDINDYRSKIDELGNILTAAGLEVEGIADQKNQFNHVVVGKLISVDKHPDADKLTLCQVDTGDGTPRQIVCGATNHRAGDYVVAATPGAVLPGDFAIKKSKIRGVESLGMLCSVKELGLGTESDGILILKEGKPGQPFSELYGLDDVVIEINVTPNRADCLSHRGLAQELAALLDRPMKTRQPRLTPAAFKTTENVKVDLIDTQKCPRYAGRSLRNVKVGPSPQWLQRRLESVGLRSINNVVDVTNYIMMDFGQPLHAFDAAQIKGAEIKIRPSVKGEKFQTLDKTELTLTGEELVIADRERAVALAGVVGGLNSGVTDSTQNLFIESAFFSAQGVRRTSRRFGFETDSSYRFSRGVNPEQTVMALERACELMIEVAGGEVASDQYDLYPQPLKKSPIPVQVSYVAERLGYPVSQPDFDLVMKRLGCLVEGGQVTPPPHRWDLAIAEDLVEEYARVYGYDRLEETVPQLLSEPTGHVPEYLQIRKTSQLLVQQGFYQAVNYAFLNKNLQDDVLGNQDERTAVGLKGLEEIPVKNPVSEDFAILRMSLLPSLVQNVSHNLRHGNRAGQIFEIGSGHSRKDGQYYEDRRLGFALWGEDQGIWKQSIPAVYRLKSYIENLLQVLLPSARKQWKTLETPLAYLHPNQTVQLLVNNQLVGFVGSVHPEKAKQQKWREDVALAELNFKALFPGNKVARFQPISSFPGIEKDLAFVMPRTLKASLVTAEIVKAGGPLLTKVIVVDRYEGEPLTKDQRSVSFRLFFESRERTLSDEEVLKLFNEIINAVSHKLSIQLR